MNPLNPPQLLEALNWRYATKIFDADKKIPAALWATLEQALVLTPTSFGLQPYQFLVVQDPAKRAALRPNSWDQAQVVDCSHFIVFTARTEITAADAKRLVAHMSVVRGVSVAAFNSYFDLIIGNLVNGPRGQTAPEWAAQQCYIALGNLMTVAALLGVDACPMEGIDKDAYDRILGLNGTGYRTVVTLALGYRSTDDKYARLAKVRYDVAELVKVV
jgi:nitroreductase